jgi:hypothetical protein
MKLWTIQGIAIYEMLQCNGIAYCTKPEWGNDPVFMRAYHWMAGQMRQRIGEPPIEGIEYPIWAWYQYNSAKDKKPPRSPKDISKGISAYMEIEIPDKEVLLSDFSAWHSPLNEGPLNDWKRIFKETDRLDKAAGRLLSFDEYPLHIQKDIEKSWEGVFDLDTRNKDLGRAHKRNRSIQATFWALKPEYIISVEFLERKGNVVKQVKL